MDNCDPCDLLLHIPCDYLDQDIERLVLTSHIPLTPQDIDNMRNRKKEQTKPKPRRELRLAFKSSELKERFRDVISNVPGRVQEAERIFQFIANAENGTSSPLCLHGNTGCGKTSLITKVLDFFQQNSGTVKIAYLNCMSTRTVNLIYTFILQKLFGGKPYRQRGSKALQQSLLSGMGNDQKTKIIVLDEIDHVINEQNFLYNMLEWLNLGAKLILILISNVIDLTVKLDSKLQSRWKFETIIFQPYNHHQIESIIYHKYRDIRNLCRRDAVSYIAKRIYNINSDIRTIDKIYSRIVGLFREGGGRQLLTIDSVKNLIYDESKDPTMQGSYAIIIKILHKAEKKSQVSGQIFQRLFLQGKGSPRSQQILYMLCDLQDTGFITLTSNKKLCDVSFHDYGIRIHQNLHIYSENANYQ